MNTNTTDQPILVAEIIPNDKLIQYAAKTDLEPGATEGLVAAFAPVFAKSRDALAGAQGVAESVRDATCVTEIRKSRQCRLALRAVRIECERIHQAQKQNALRYGRAVDGFRNILLADIEPVERALEDAENTAERAESARKSALRAEREAELRPLSETPISVDLAEISDADFARMLDDARLLRRTKLEAAAKLEAERLAKEQAEREERARIAAELARLKAEAEETRRVADLERKRMEAEQLEERRKADADRARIEHERAAERRKAEQEAAELRRKLDEQIQAEAKAKAKVEAEEKARKAAERKAANAPDRQKLEVFSAALRCMVLPAFSNAQLKGELSRQVNALADWCESKENDL